MSKYAVAGAAMLTGFSPGIVSEGKTLWVSVQGPLAGAPGKRKYVEGSIQDETQLTLENIGAILEAAGSGPEHVVRCGIWLADLADYDGMNEVYSAFFPEPMPARTTLQAGLMVGKVEIDCVAVVP